MARKTYLTATSKGAKLSHIEHPSFAHEPWCGAYSDSWHRGASPRLTVCPRCLIREEEAKAEKAPKLASASLWSTPPKSKDRDDRGYRGYTREPETILDSINTPFPLSHVTTGTPGKLFAGYLPGKKGVAVTRTNATWSRSMPVDMSVLAVNNVAITVPLIEDFEFETLGAQDYWEQAQAHGIEVRWHPIRDMDAPRAMAPTAALVADLVAALQAGQNVFVHCRGGHGRTGTIVACILAKLGVAPKDAIDRVRTQHDKRAVATLTQERFVYTFAGVPEVPPATKQGTLARAFAELDGVARAFGKATHTPLDADFNDTPADVWSAFDDDATR